MTPLRAFPRLSRGETLLVREHMLRQAADSPRRMSDLAGVTHPKASGIPTGAHVANPEEIAAVRKDVMQDLSAWPTDRPVQRQHTAEFDRDLGQALARHLRILPADAGHEETWSFLAAIVFPDLTWMRYPDLHKDRVLGVRHRNVLRRAWFRQTILGDLQFTEAGPLGEDELVNLFERPSLSMNVTLLRTLARLVLAYDGPDRSEYARSLTRRAVMLTGTFLLDGLTESQLLEHLAPDPHTLETMLTAHGMVPHPLPSSATATSPRDGSRPPSADQIPERLTAPRGKPSDLVARFHRHMLRLTEEVASIAPQAGRVLHFLVNRDGGLKTARAWAAPDSEHALLDVLQKAKRLDLSIEALVIQPVYRPLFSEEFLEAATERLRKASRRSE